TKSATGPPATRPNTLHNPMESSSEFDGYSHGRTTQNAIRNRLLRSASGIPSSGQVKESLEQCFSYNSMDDFCAGTSLRDSILDERRVFRSSDGMVFAAPENFFFEDCSQIT